MDQDWSMDHIIRWQWSDLDIRMIKAQQKKLWPLAYFDVKVVKLVYYLRSYFVSSGICSFILICLFQFIDSALGRKTDYSFTMTIRWRCYSWSENFNSRWKCEFLYPYLRGYTLTEIYISWFNPHNNFKRWLPSLP